MNITVKFTSEYVYNKIKLDKTRKMVENTIQEYEQKFCMNYCRFVKVIGIAEFLDERKNEKEIITIENYNIIGEMKKIMQTSEGLYKLIKIIEIKIL